MSWLYLLFLALIQGLTEFLPISSSAHLILPAQLWGWEDQGVLIDVMAHFGTLFAVLLYFRDDVKHIIFGFFHLVQGQLNPDSMLALNLILATPPALILAALISFGGYETMLRSPLLIALATIFFGILLWLSDVWGREEISVDGLTWRGALALGLAQMLALIPGTSRSGITMTAARAMGFTRREAARFSMLMSVPIISVGGLYALYKLSRGTVEGAAGGASLSQGFFVALLSFAVAYVTISAFMKYVPRIGMFPFMLYRLALGIGLLIWIF